MIIDGNNLIAGRLASYAAKQALLGNEIEVINSEKILITGSKADVMKKQLHRQERGHPYKGPFIPKREDKFMRRMIRGMLPHKQPRGIAAYAKVKCHIGVPEELEGKETITTRNEYGNLGRSNVRHCVLLDALNILLSNLNKLESHL